MLAGVLFSGLATWCHPQPVRRSAHGTSALICPWIISKGPADCHQDCLLGFYFQSPLCGLPANIVSLALAFSPPTPSPVTVVCYQSDRDELRRRVIQWLEAEIIPDGWFSKGSNYSEVLDKYFKASRACLRGWRTFLGQPCPPSKRLHSVEMLRWGPEGSGVPCSVVCCGLPAAAAWRSDLSPGI